MYSHWKRQGKPRTKSGFTWTQPTGTGFVFSSPIWSGEHLGHFVSEVEPFGFVARTPEGKGYLVFRGTDSGADWVVDAEATQSPYDLVAGYGNVHHGFLELYKSMRGDVLGAMDEVGTLQRLFVTGHSLGCGLSTLAVPAVIDARDYDSVTRSISSRRLRPPCSEIFSTSTSGLPYECLPLRARPSAVTRGAVGGSYKALASRPSRFSDCPLVSRTVRPCWRSVSVSCAAR
jgi:hypothetical protein